jgi:hypothetical protein
MSVTLELDNIEPEDDLASESDVPVDNDTVSDDRPENEKISRYRAHHEKRVKEQQVGADVSQKILEYWNLIDFDYLFTTSLYDGIFEYTSTQTFWNRIWNDEVTKEHKTGWDKVDINHYGNGYVTIALPDNKWLFIDFDYGSCENCDTVSSFSKRRQLLAYFEKYLSCAEVLSNDELGAKLEEFDFSIDGS